ncbi:phosphoadenylyl-sulfate reductase [Brachybacterium sp. EF45031]|uniref:phosphoadenylyl-sulfate reductase n=1 Tax=Brachybacterium sillae TaxID=2810536 RepID=UPI00217E2C5A|nr:phosphoadenylyl-sulfate reductase [Brachybacterium sillae]MCS6710873.1 phosphoadenylyl-sulfate reductase [Brachybacterium sillae]
MTDVRVARAERLQALAEEAAEHFRAREGEVSPEELAQEISVWAAETFGDRLAVACSMADATLPHVVAQHAPGVDVLFLETGYHFPETLTTRDAVAQALPVHVVDVSAPQSVPEQDAEHGPQLWARDPGLCCALRKVAPLRGALAGYDAWVTGVRRDEGPTRAQTPLVTWDEGFGLVKINPLALWTFDEVMAYSRRHGLPENPLLQQGYPSIGCAPCTQRVAPGADPRSGRWAGFEKTECGLHPGTDGGSHELAEDAPATAGSVRALDLPSLRHGATDRRAEVSPTDATPVSETSKETRA